MIMDELRDLNIAAITREGAMTGVDKENPQEQTQPQVRLAVYKKESPIDPKQKEVFWGVKSDFISPEVPSTSAEIKDMTK